MRLLTAHECQSVSGGIDGFSPAALASVQAYLSGGAGPFRGLTVLPDFRYPGLPLVVPSAPIGIAVGGSLGLSGLSNINGGSAA